MITVSVARDPCDRRGALLLSEDGTTFSEVDLQAYEVATGPKHAYESPVLHFEGKMVDVHTGEILGTYDFEAGANYSLAQDYQATLELDDEGWIVIDENFDYDDPSWIARAKQRLESQVLQTVGNIIKSSQESE